MTAVERHHSKLFLKSKSNSAIGLLAQICPICLFITMIFNFFVLVPSFLVRLKICLGHSAKLGSQKIGAASRIGSTIQTILLFNSSCCHILLAFMTLEHWQLAKLRFISSLKQSLANSQQSRSNALLNNRFTPQPEEKKTGERTREKRFMSMDGTNSREMEANFFDKNAPYTF